MRSSPEGALDISPGRKPGEETKKRHRALEGRQKSLNLYIFRPFRGSLYITFYSGGLRPRLISLAPPGAIKTELSDRNQLELDQDLFGLHAPQVSQVFQCVKSGLPDMTVLIIEAILQQPQDLCRQFVGPVPEGDGNLRYGQCA